MNKFIRRAVMAALVSAASATAMTALMPAYAAAPAKKPEPPKVRREVGVPLSEALKLLTANDLDGAYAKLMVADLVQMKSPFEEYSVSEYFGAIAIKKMDFMAATAAFNRQVAS